MYKKITKILLACIMAAVILFAAVGCSNSGSKKLSVETTTVQNKNFSTKVDITGVLVPSQSVNLSLKSIALVKSVNVAVGQKVNAGDVVINLDTSQLAAQLAQYQAALDTAVNQNEQAKISLNNAQLNLNRVKELFNAGGTSQSALDSAQSSYDVAKAQYEGSTASAVRQAQASVDNIRTQINDSYVTSPISGVVTNKNVNAGESVIYGTVLATIADTDTLKLKGIISQQSASYIKVGQNVDVLVDVLKNKKFDGVVTSVGPVASGTGEYFPVEISVKNTGELSAGLTAYATVNIDLENQTVVPISAVAKNNGEDHVFTIKDGVAHQKTVKTGLKNENEIVIFSGIEPNETVASTNVNNLFDNMVVDINKNSQKKS